MPTYNQKAVIKLLLFYIIFFIEFRLKSMLKFAKSIALPSKIGTHINEKCSFYFVLSFNDHFFSTIQHQR